VAGSFIQTLTMVDVATGWTECLPLVTRESGLVVEAMARAQSLFPWLIVGADFDGVETAKLIARLDAAARLHVNFFQPSFKLKDKRREGAKVIKRYHAPATPYARALAHAKVGKAVKRRLRESYRTLDPVAPLAEVRAAQTHASIAGGRATAPQPSAHHHRRRMRRSSRAGLARRSKQASRVPRTGASGDPTRREFACPQCSIRIWPTSRAGLPPSLS